MSSCDYCAEWQIWEPATTKVVVGGGVSRACAKHAGMTRLHREPGSALRAQQEAKTAPHNGTETSRESAKFAEQVITPQQQQILGFLATKGEQGATREEIAAATNLSNQTACARLKPLEDAGVISTEGKRLASTGRNQQVYLLTALRVAA